jgi:hypothetical protein
MIGHAVASVLLSTIFTGLCSAQEFMRCNGHEAFCDRRYNEIAQINSHNATSYAASPVQNQDRSIDQQLDDGIRVFKLPIHMDYQKHSDYYADLIESYLHILNNKIHDVVHNIINNKKKLAHTINEKRSDVDSLQHSINAAEHKIQDLNKWYNGLEDFSFSNLSSKTTRSIDYAARVSAFIIEKKALEAAKIIAKKALDAAKSSMETFLENDPRLLGLKTQKFAAEKVLGMIKKQGTREIFSCHTLAKRELYNNYINKLIEQAPSEIRSVVKVFLTPFSILEKGGIKLLFGTASQGGGIAPYPTCFLDRSATPLKDFLRKIKNFLNQHPHDVITLLLNDFIYDPEKISKVFEEVGLIQFVHTQDREEPWPTFKELIEQGKRLIVFSDVEYDQAKYPWLNYRNFYNAWEGAYDFKSTQDFINPQTPLEKFGDFIPRDKKYLDILNAKINQATTDHERKALVAQYKRVSAMVDPNGPHNMLLDIHYAVTAGLAGNKDDAKVINKKSVFRSHMKRIAKAAQHIPNFISIDFYEHPHVTNPKGDVFDVIDELNGVGRYAGKPLWSPQT